MNDFKKLTEQLLKIYINAESINDFGIENYFDENISLIGTGKHELFTNLHEFLESFKVGIKRRGKSESKYKIYIRKKNGLMMIMFLHTEQ